MANDLDIKKLINGLIIDPNGDKRYYLNDKYHRVDGPAVEYTNGNKWWYLNGKLHRVNGPAVDLCDGTKRWYLHDKLHRKDGPAIEYADGRKLWYLNDKLINCHSQEQFERLMRIKAFW